jgi:hypothetical protein
MESTTQQVQLSTWKGSEDTYKLVKQQILDRFGPEAAEQFDPLKNCFTFNHWKAIGYIVKKGEKSLKSYTWIKSEKVLDGQPVAETYCKNVHLFFISQVQPLNPTAK